MNNNLESQLFLQVNDSFSYWMCMRYFLEPTLDIQFLMSASPFRLRQSVSSAGSLSVQGKAQQIYKPQIQQSYKQTNVCPGPLQLVSPSLLPLASRTSVRPLLYPMVSWTMLA